MRGLGDHPPEKKKSFSTKRKKLFYEKKKAFLRKEGTFLRKEGTFLRKKFFSLVFENDVGDGKFFFVAVGNVRIFDT